MLTHRTAHFRLTFLGLGVVIMLAGCGGGDSGAKAAAGGSSTGGTTGNAGSGSDEIGGTTGNAGSGSDEIGGSNPTVGGSNADAGNVDASAGGTTSESDCGPIVVDEGFVEVPVSDPNIRYVGRVTKTAELVAFALPTVQIQTVFEGDAIDMRLRDHGLGTAVATNFYWIIVDGAQQKLKVCPAREVYPLARNLGPGPHTLTVVKRTESGPGGQEGAGIGEFLGFRVRPGTALAEVSKPTRLMEFVGDSITCGYGDEVSTTDPDSYKFTSINEDGYNAYGAVTARAFGADYVAVAVSGRGVVRNYTGLASPLVPEIYERTLPDEVSAPAWDFSLYSPDVVVINLGTNDFSPGIELDQLDAFRATFKTGYVEFLSRIREVHPQASIIAAVGPMMSDYYPDGYNAWTSIQADVAAVVEERHSSGDADVHYFAFEPQVSPYGEDWHPTLTTHQKMADVLVPFISGVRGW
jgi:lysophospholipase L1-like esterase